ncbi:hypothetical protein E1301_Tti019563 [Triplophysa tibetana]|uniref:Uncharacterized protein n=1 Tax=Triplophysa tibetana TaxID=1572043 RepID=A0A5A9P0U2_9TELE|nr:hypothetical protein E1301_Tti019563 [Triplophysa tibetana]
MVTTAPTDLDGAAERYTLKPSRKAQPFVSRQRIDVISCALFTAPASFSPQSILWDVYFGGVCASLPTICQLKPHQLFHNTRSKTVLAYDPCKAEINGAEETAVYQLFPHCVSVSVITTISGDLYGGIRLRVDLSRARSPTGIKSGEVRQSAAELQIRGCNCFSAAGQARDLAFEGRESALSRQKSFFDSRSNICPPFAAKAALSNCRLVEMGRQYASLEWNNRDINATGQQQTAGIFSAPLEFVYSVSSLKRQHYNCLCMCNIVAKSPPPLSSRGPGPCLLMRGVWAASVSKNSCGPYGSATPPHSSCYKRVFICS